MAKPTLAFSVEKLEGRTLLLWMHENAEPDDATWDDALKAGRAALSEQGPGKVAFLVITDGGAPTSTQRKRLFEAMNGAHFPIAVMNTNPLIRGVVTAISWFNPDIKAFAPTRFAEAVDYLGFSADGVRTILEAMGKLESKLGVPYASLKAAIAAQA
jgi:hypothetical protein